LKCNHLRGQREPRQLVGGICSAFAHALALDAAAGAAARVWPAAT
jgi:hypothetical protein